MVSCHCECDVVTLCHGVTRCVSRYVTCSLSECQTPTDTLSPVLDSLVPLRPALSSQTAARSSLSQKKVFPSLRSPQPRSDTARAETWRPGALSSAGKVGPTPTHLLRHTRHTLANCIVYGVWCSVHLGCEGCARLAVLWSPGASHS